MYHALANCHVFVLKGGQVDHTANLLMLFFNELKERSFLTPEIYIFSLQHHWIEHEHSISSFHIHFCACLVSCDCLMASGVAHHRALYPKFFLLSF